MPTMTRAEAEALGIIPKKKKRSKYNVDHSAEGKAKRTFRGRVYASITERDCAELLWNMVDDGDYLDVVPQPIVQLGEDFTYQPDFLVVDSEHRSYYLDAKGRYFLNKGATDRRFNTVRRLWKKYGRLPLIVTVPDKKESSGWRDVERIEKQ